MFIQNKEWEGKGALPPPPPLQYTYYSHWKGWSLKLMYIKLPMYLFFYMALRLNDFDVGKSITQAIGRGRPWNLDFFGHRSLPFQGPKKSRFPGPPLPMALVMDIARIKIITSRAIWTKGTLIVLIFLWCYIAITVMLFFQLMYYEVGELLVVPCFC
jgi:hypothetical protein